jgi:hypothetical protein
VCHGIRVGWWNFDRILGFELFHTGKGLFFSQSVVQYIFIDPDSSIENE